ncbi:ExbD/TolR family protein [Cellvibrio polysaccharolyticus]|uniref:Biopolymer transporter ExbD n=1 Tax=Cellvibrio polysaccharolyticus TaxID=2082724 RepID=A0A928V291_9GAMM|nr:biopolymer transporter ExbD [Cellvibrio polysaccharolyticus]MBE8717443.1 biopolymer transporter ExbD [Cellvibrio polysaccharolyticus]
MQFRRQRREDDMINLTPLIDVVFLLLIFFMVSTTFTKNTHLTIDLPEAVGNPSTETGNRLDVVIGADGGYQVNGQGLINNQAETLKTALLQLSDGDTQTPLTITADARTPHQAVVTAMDVAGQAGFVRLSITTREPQAESP